MSNVTAKPGQMASFKCQVDMSCIVAYIEWYHEMDNGTEKLIKVGILFRLSLFRNSYRNEQLKYLCTVQLQADTRVTIQKSENLKASFKCQVDMSCIVAYIEWYHEMDNGTEKLIKVGILFRLSLFRNSYWNEQLEYLCNYQGSFWKEFDRACILNSK